MPKWIEQVINIVLFNVADDVGEWPLEKVAEEGK